MKAQLFWRKAHYWVSIVVALPVLLVICTGLLLQVKKNVAWIQPPEQRGRGGPPQVTFDHVLRSVSEIPHVQVRGWDDIHRIDLRPAEDVLKVTTHSGWEVQLDPVDGAVLQTAVRRSDLIESLHDGSWFGEAAKLGVFLPAGLLLAFLWGTGIYLFLLPQMRKRRPAQIGRA